MAQSPLSRRAVTSIMASVTRAASFIPRACYTPQCGVIEICSFQEHLSIGKFQDISRHSVPNFHKAITYCPSLCHPTTSRRDVISITPD